MPDDELALAKRIVEAYRTSGIAAKIHGGNLFIEREEGWEGPINPTSIRTTSAEDNRTIVGKARTAASQVFEDLNEDRRQMLKECSEPAFDFLTDSDALERLGYHDRGARTYVSIIRFMSIYKEFIRD